MGRINPYKQNISIHALLAESDNSANKNLTQVHHFYPRSPCGERPLLSSFIIVYVKISIHALLAESDADRDADWVRVYVFLSTLSLRRATRGEQTCCGFNIHFYPRSPCGERHLTKYHFTGIFKFLSTLSLRRATLPVFYAF